MSIVKLDSENDHEARVAPRPEQRLSRQSNKREVLPVKADQIRLDRHAKVSDASDSGDQIIPTNARSTSSRNGYGLGGMQL